ncbi:MAG: hypothetical protein HN416_10120 [Nitrospina sp.]|nr:hypothetical protein [Nitrospina sp.]
MRLLPTTRHAVQATVAVSAVYGLSILFPQLERPYWGVVTALVVLCQTWSESIKKAAQRVAATFLGLVTAVILCRVLGSQSIAETIVIFVCVFLFSYTAARSYLWAIFWMSIMVIMMFDMLGRMDHQLVLERMIETLLGAGMAVLVSTVILPVRARDQLRSDVPQFLRLVKRACVQAMNDAMGMDSKREGAPHGLMLKNFQKVRDEFLTRQRETFLLRREPSQLRRWIFWMEMLVFYTSDIHHAVEQAHGALPAEGIRDEMMDLRDGIADALDQLAQYAGRSEPVTVAPAEELRGTIREKLGPLITGDAEQCSACLSFLPVLYYVDKIYGVLEEMASIVNSRE